MSGWGLGRVKTLGGEAHVERPAFLPNVLASKGQDGSKTAAFDQF